MSYIRFNDWSLFKTNFLKLVKLPIKSEKEMCEVMNISYNFYEKVIDAAVRGWHVSPSQSLFQGIAKTKLKIPMKSQTIFHNLMEQTRFILLLDEHRIISKMMFSIVKNNKQVITVRNEKARTLSNSNENIVQKFNEVLQILFLYRYYSHIQLKCKKIPKKLYRGIRYQDICNLSFIDEEMKNIDTKALNWKEIRVLKMNLIKKHLLTHGLNDFPSSKLLSFTSSQSVAKYFTNNTGFIIEIPTDNIDIFSSELQDERFNKKDFVSNKFEKEYIVPITNKTIKVSNVIINDLDYFVEQKSPLAVPLFDHDNLRATYMLNNEKIEARFVWFSNTSGGLRYRNITQKSYSLSSQEFKNNYGFSPSINKQTINAISEFEIHVK